MLKPSQIEARVKDLLRQHGEKAAPVCLERIAQKLRAVIRSEPFDGDISGALYRKEGNPVIGVNALHPPVRRRFTIAHELGHLCLHAEPLHVDWGRNLGMVPNPTGTKPEFGFLRDRVSSEAKDPKEIEANRFAACLLMPAHFLEKDLRTTALPVEEHVVEKLAKKYGVSQQAMTFRLMNLGVPIDTF